MEELLGSGGKPKPLRLYDLSTEQSEYWSGDWTTRGHYHRRTRCCSDPSLRPGDCCMQDQV
jgi:hypothetical protein